MAFGDVFQVVLNYTWNDSIDCTNVWYYRQTTSGATAAPALNYAFGIEVFPKIEAVAPSFIAFGLQPVTNIKSPTDFYPGDWEGIIGQRSLTSNAAPSFLALQYVSGRAHPGTRSCRKRFPFLYESDIFSNQLETSFRTALDVAALGDAMSVPISGLGETFEPVAVKRPVKLGFAPVVSYVIGSVPFTAQGKISTQNSRKT